MPFQFKEEIPNNLDLLKKLSLKKKKKFFFILAVLCLHCSAQSLHCSVGAFCSCSVWASRGAQATELLGFSSCGAGLAVLGHVGS